MRVLAVQERIKYLEKEVRVRQKLINRSLRPGEEALPKRVLEVLQLEIAEIDDVIEELEDAMDKGEPVYINEYRFL